MILLVLYFLLPLAASLKHDPISKKSVRNHQYDKIQNHGRTTRDVLYAPNREGLQQLPSNIDICRKIKVVALTALTGISLASSAATVNAVTFPIQDVAVAVNSNEIQANHRNNPIRPLISDLSGTKLFGHLSSHNLFIGHDTKNSNHHGNYKVGHMPDFLPLIGHGTKHSHAHKKYTVHKMPEFLKRNVFALGNSAVSSQSPGWELSRQKRTLAIKQMADKGMLTVDTDDSGNQFLSLPWIPDYKLEYKSLSIWQRLQNEVCAGAFGEVCKDFLLHPVDTAKVRRQAAKKNMDNDFNSTSSLGFTTNGEESLLVKAKSFYVGFPVVMASSIPQGGIFFLVKKGLLEIKKDNFPLIPEFVASMVSIGAGVVAYWVFRTPAEVIKIQVQTGQSDSVMSSIQQAKTKSLLELWKYYTVNLALDIPFQVMNFILYGVISDAVLNAGFEASTLTRLFCGVTCGMICAGITCPLDVSKTRIIARDKASTVTAAGGGAGSGGTSLFASPASVTVSKPNSHEHCDKVSEGKTALAESKLTPTSDSNTTAADFFVSFDSTGDPTRSNDALTNKNALVEIVQIFQNEGVGALFLGLRQRLIYTGLANGIRLAAYGTSRMDLMMRSLDDI